MQTAEYIRNYPLIRITLAYIAGIGIVSFTPNFNNSLLLTVFCSLILVSIVWLITKNNRALSFIYKGMFFYIVFVLAGIFNYHLSHQYYNFPKGEMYYSGVVESSPVFKERSIQTDCRIMSMETGENIIPLYEKVRLYLEPDTARPVPVVGDSLIFTGQLNKIINPGNPGEFDYSGYMKHLGIYYSGYITKTDYYIGGNSGRFRIIRLSTFIQDQLILCFKRYGIKNNELAVLSALTAGNRNYLEQELRESYAAVGAMHILAVSGLHVGILYLLLASLFGNRNQKGYFRLIRTLVILAVIWMYAFITGLSSSVLRASLMFSLFLIGKNLRRQVDSYNILAASALLILLINPSELFKVGFQFSYLAVLGIIFFQPKLEQLIFIRNGFIDRIWQLVTVSIAAQLITFPLSLYYFHQFPVYFWLTNILVIPLVWLIMATAILFSALIPVTFLMPFIAGILNVLLKILNLAIILIGELPYSTITEIRFNTVHLLAFYCFLLILMIIIVQKSYRYIIHSLCLLFIVILLFDSIGIRKQAETKELIVYNVRNNNLVISIIDGMNHTVVTKGIDSSTYDNTIQYLKNYWISKKINRYKKEIPVENQLPVTEYLGANLKLKFIREGFLIDFYDTRLFYFKNASTFYSDTCIDNKDKILWVDYDSGFPDKKIYTNYMPDTILVSNSLSRYRKKNWQEFAGKCGIGFYDLTEKGSFRKIILAD